MICAAHCFNDLEPQNNVKQDNGYASFPGCCAQAWDSETIFILHVSGIPAFQILLLVLTFPLTISWTHFLLNTNSATVLILEEHLPSYSYSCSIPSIYSCPRDYLQNVCWLTNHPCQHCHLCPTSFNEFNYSWGAKSKLPGMDYKPLTHHTIQLRSHALCSSYTSHV